MQWIDLSIVAVYLVGVLGVMAYFRARAARSSTSYFLGDRSMRWWVLGASGMASNVDMAGTMVIASLLYVFGAKGFFIEFRGGVVLIMAFFMAFMGKWTRRSGCVTVGEWMQFRFGPGLAGEMPRLFIAIFNIVFTVWAIAYFTVGSTKFFEVYLPWSQWIGAAPDSDAFVAQRHLAATALSVGMILFVTVYSAVSGLHGVVWTDVFQGVLILFFALYVSIRAMLAADPAVIEALAGPGWSSLALPRRIDLPEEYAAFRLFQVGVTLYLLRAIFDGMSGPGGYTAQRYLAARDEHDCARLSALWIVLMAFRWPLMMGVAILAMVEYGPGADPESILPAVLRDVAPVGIRGVLLAALIAAAMSTYSGFMNAGASYVVKDIYQLYLDPRASEPRLVAVGYVSTLVLVLLGVALAFQTATINQIWDYLNMGLGAGMLVPGLLRWYWWRFNGWGFAAGAAAGMAAALGRALLGQWAPQAAAAYFPPEHDPFLTFGLVAAFSLAAAVAVSLVTPAPASEVLRHFVATTRPFGWWGPVLRDLPSGQAASIRRENRADIAAVFLAVPWQVAVFLSPMMLVLRQWTAAAVLAALALALSAALASALAAPGRAAPNPA